MNGFFIQAIELIHRIEPQIKIITVKDNLIKIFKTFKEILLKANVRCFKCPDCRCIIC